MLAAWPGPRLEDGEPLQWGRTQGCAPVGAEPAGRRRPCGQCPRSWPVAASAGSGVSLELPPPAAAFLGPRALLASPFPLTQCSLRLFLGAADVSPSSPVTFSPRFLPHPVHGSQSRPLCPGLCAVRRLSSPRPCNERRCSVLAGPGGGCPGRPLPTRCSPACPWAACLPCPGVLGLEQTPSRRELGPATWFLSRSHACLPPWCHSGELGVEGTWSRTDLEPEQTAPSGAMPWAVRPREGGPVGPWPCPWEPRVLGSILPPGEG